MESAIRIRSLIVLTLLVTGGCTTTIIAPSNPSNPATVLITDYGRHSSLLLPDGDGRMVEYTFGDWQWYALDHHNPINAIFALIHSPQSTLGRRWIFIQPDAPGVAQEIGATRIERVTLDGNRVIKLRQDLDRQYMRHIDSLVFSPGERLYFVHSDESYNALHNCNRATADWLREMGAEVEGAAIFSQFRIVPAEQNSQ